MVEAANILAVATPQGAAEWTMFLVLGAVSAMVFGMAKVGFGGGVGILSVPLMVFACRGDAMLATGLMLPLLVAADYTSVVAWWRKWDWPTVGKVLPGVVVGIAAGTWLLVIFRRMGAERLSGAALAAGIALISIAFVVLHVLQMRSGRQWTFQPVFWQACIGGALIGLTSTLAHAAGPIAAMYLLAQNMPKQRFVATSAMMFWLVNQLKLIPYGLLGMINTQTLWLGACLIPAVLAGAGLGIWLHRRLSQQHFTGVVYALLALAAVHMLYQAAARLFS